MAFPAIRASSSFSFLGTVGTAAGVHEFTAMPTHVAGDVILIFVRHGTVASNSFTDWRSGWTPTTGINGAFWKVATSASEPDFWVDVGGTARHTVWVGLSISGVDVDAAQFIHGAHLATTIPGISPALTVPWGTADNLFVAGWTATNRSNSGSSGNIGAPASYTFRDKRSSTGGSATYLAQIFAATRNLAAASDDPGAWVFTQPDGPRYSDVITHLIALRPLGVGGGRRRSPLLMTPW